jgi:hypothetical protein
MEESEELSSSDSFQIQVMLVEVVEMVKLEEEGGGGGRGMQFISSYPLSSRYINTLSFHLCQCLQIYLSFGYLHKNPICSTCVSYRLNAPSISSSLILSHE